MTRRVNNIIGMCEHTGRKIDGIDHVRQSLARIISTAIGTRVQRRSFGVGLVNIVSAPGNATTRLKAINQIGRAILKWEPRVKLSHMLFSANAQGQAVIELVCTYDGVVLRDTLPVGEAS